jgi:hypothetical protein
MSTYSIMSRIVQLGSREHVVTVSAIAHDLGGAEVRQDTAPTAWQAQARRGFLEMSLATELRARGHRISGVISDESHVSSASI